jgi:hypothetical protein
VPAPALAPAARREQRARREQADDRVRGGGQALLTAAPQLDDGLAAERAAEVAVELGAELRQIAIAAADERDVGAHRR